MEFPQCCKSLAALVRVPALLLRFVNGIYGICRLLRRHYSALIPANLITLPHFSVSSAMSLPKSAEEPARIAPPKSASRILIVGFANAALACVLRRLMMSWGVFRGAPSPCQALAS